MSGPKLSAFELEQMRKAELERIELEKTRLKALALHDIQEINALLTWCKNEQEVLKKQRYYLDASSLSEREKANIGSRISKRDSMLSSLLHACSLMDRRINGTSLEEIRQSQLIISEKAASCRKIKAVYDNGAEEHKASINIIAENITDSSPTESYSLEQALAVLPARYTIKNDSLKQDKEELLQRLERILTHPKSSPAERARTKNAARRIGMISDKTELRDFASLVVQEIERDISIRTKLLEEYAQQIAIEDALIISLGNEMPIRSEPPESKEEIRRLIANSKNTVKLLEDELMRKAEQEEIAKSIDKVMKEMGYEIIGEKHSMTTSRSKLFLFDDYAGLEFTQQKSGNIRIQVVGLSDEDKTPDETEVDELYKQQVAFCKEYDSIIEALRKEGVVIKPGTVIRRPPDRAFCEFVDVTEYNPDFVVNERIAEQDSCEHEMIPRRSSKPKILSKP